MVEDFDALVTDLTNNSRYEAAVVGGHNSVIVTLLGELEPVGAPGPPWRTLIQDLSRQDVLSAIRDDLRSLTQQQLGRLRLLFDESDQFVEVSRSEIRAEIQDILPPAAVLRLAAATTRDRTFGEAFGYSPAPSLSVVRKAVRLIAKSYIRATTGQVSRLGSAPFFRASGDTLIIEDDIARYTTVASMEGDGTPKPGDANYGIRTLPGSRDVDGNFALVTGRGGTGQAVRAHLTEADAITPGQPGCSWRWPVADDLVAFRSPGLSTPLAPFVFEGWFRVNAGARYSDNGPKWFNMSTHANPAARTQIQIKGFGTAENPGALFYITPESRGPFARQPRGSGSPRWEDFNDGLWHKWSVYYKGQTTDNWPAEGSRDGVIRAWIDGKKICDLSAAAAGVTPPGGDKEWCSITEVDSIRDYEIQRFFFPSVSFMNAGDTIDVDWTEIGWWEITDGKDWV